MSVVKKKKSPNGKVKVTKKTTAAELEKLAKLKHQQYNEESAARFHKAKNFYDEQDDETQEAIDRMAAVFMTIGPSQMWVSPSRTGPREIIYFTEDERRWNALWLAVECAKDLGLMDIRIANFKFIKRCVECGRPVKRK